MQPSSNLVTHFKQLIQSFSSTMYFLLETFIAPTGQVELQAWQYRQKLYLFICFLILLIKYRSLRSKSVTLISFMFEENKTLNKGASFFKTIISDNFFLE